MNASAPRVVIRLGSHAEKEYVVKLERFLDGLIVGANLFEATPGATASLLLRVGAKNTHLYIDPMTYAYGAYVDPKTRAVRSDLDWIKSDQVRKDASGRKKNVRDFKRSYRSLSERLGTPFDQAIRSGRAVTPSTLLDSKTRVALCRATVAYQIGRMTEELEKDEDLRDYLDDAPRPAAVFAPYFYVEPSQTTEWLAANLSLMKTTVSLGLDVPVHGVLCADASHLTDADFLGRLVGELAGTGVKGIWLWFSEFFEDAVEEAVLESYKRLVVKLARELEVHAMHGGLFSLLLSKYGMTGVSHGVGYGEQKSVVPIIGQSVPMVRYYLPALARRLGVPAIERAFDALGVQEPVDFHERVCDCTLCRGVVVSSLEEFSSFGDMYFSRPTATRQAQTPAAAKRCRFHFLLARLREREDVRSMDLGALLARMRDAELAWGAQPSLRRDSGHMKRWRRVLAPGGEK